MSDRIWFATFQGASAAASSGFSGLPIPVPEIDSGEIGDPLYKPIPRSLLIDLVWRIKRLKITADLSFTYSAIADPTIQVTNSFVGEITYPFGGYSLGRNEDTGATVESTPPSRERDIVFYPDSDGGHGGTSSAEWDDVGDPAPPEHATGGFSVDFGAGSFTGINAGFFEINGRIGLDFYGAWEVGRIWSRIHQFPASGRVLAGQSQFWPSHPSGGLVVDFYATVLSGTTIDINSATLIAEPEEYWPYANSQGLPIYDTATGAQLRDPLS